MAPSIHPLLDVHHYTFVLLQKAARTAFTHKSAVNVTSVPHLHCPAMRPLPMFPPEPLPPAHALTVHNVHHASHVTQEKMLLQRQAAPQEGMGGPGQKQRNQTNTAGATLGKAECTASLALTMLLMLKRYLKATYSMSEERIAAFSPDLLDKRKQVCLLMAAAPVSPD